MAAADQGVLRANAVPDYDDIDSRETLVMKGKTRRFAAALDRQLPNDAIVLEAGCGTGQLTNFLGLSWKRRVLGGDICLNSPQLANGFRERYRIINAAFLQMNLFRPPFRDNSVDFLICNGVLHHTGDASKGFETCFAKSNRAAASRCPRKLQMSGIFPI
ncbi:MAG TPA: class I SAM-dependent methyltransferase [Pseudolabrys sp.]|nr:class I SAM-dependent methyltransferase [Pseudolabrys sp.]